MLAGVDKQNVLTHPQNLIVCIDEAKSDAFNIHTHYEVNSRLVQGCLWLVSSSATRWRSSNVRKDWLKAFDYFEGEDCAKSCCSSITIVITMSSDTMHRYGIGEKRQAREYLPLFLLSLSTF